MEHLSDFTVDQDPLDPREVEGPRQREAYRVYLRLGIKRSIKRLKEALDEQWDGGGPSEDALRRWERQHGWVSRAIQDDELINRRAMERIRERMAADIERRRAQRLQLSDVQMVAAMNAMVVKGENKETGREETRPRDLLAMDPAKLRAVNDTIRLAAETQRLDSGEATTRIAAHSGEGPETVAPIAVQHDQAIYDELRRFVAVSQLPVSGEQLPEDADDDEENEVREEPRALPPPVDEDLA